MYDIIVIGGGAAGMTAALNSLRSNKTVLLLEKETIGGQIATSPRVENFPTIKAIAGNEFADKLFDQVMNLGCDFELDNVLKIDKIENKFIVTCEFSTYEAKSVIIATGLKHKTINIPHEEELIGKGVSYCAVCDGAFYKDQVVCVVGDGNTALQYSMLLSNYCPKVYLCTLFDKFFGDKTLIEKVKQRENIEIIHDITLKEFIFKDEIEGLKFEGTYDKKPLELKIQGCFIAIGQIPNNEMFSNVVELDKDGYIIASEDLETKTPGLFVAGDCRVKKFRQLTTAVSDGAIASIGSVTYVDKL